MLRMGRLSRRGAFRKITFFLVIFLLGLTFLYQDTGGTFAGNTSQYLVLIQQKNGTWKRYENLIEKSAGGSLMVKAKPLSKALGLTYKKNKGGFTIKRGSSRLLTFTRDQKEYIYTKGTSHTAKTAPEQAYISKQSDYNLCQVSTLSNLVYYKLFNSARIKGYESYKGVICYSKYEPIPEAIPDTAPKPTEKPTPTPIPEPTAISIEGVDFPVRDRFLSIEDTLSDWGGAAEIWRKLELEVDRKILASTDLVVETDRIGFSHLVTGGNGVYLTKSTKGYQIKITVKLSGSVLAKQNAEILKAMVATISSKPTMVYTAIYDSFTSQETHGIKENAYVVIGDCKIKVVIKEGEVTYSILKA